VRSFYERQRIQLNMNKSGLHGLEWKTRDPYSLADDSLVLLSSQFWPIPSMSRGVINSVKQRLSHPLSRIKSIDE